MVIYLFIFKLSICVNLIILFIFLHHHFLLSYVTHQTYCSTAKLIISQTYLCYLKIFIAAKKIGQKFNPSDRTTFSPTNIMNCFFASALCRPGHPLSSCTPGQTLVTAQPPSSFLSSLLYLTVSAAVRAQPFPYLLRDIA